MVQRDVEACTRIVGRIQSEQIAEEFRLQQTAQRKNKIRAAFLRRHEQNIQLEQTAGVRKSYSRIAKAHI